MNSPFPMFAVTLQDKPSNSHKNAGKGRWWYLLQSEICRFDLRAWLGRIMSALLGQSFCGVDFTRTKFPMVRVYGRQIRRIICCSSLCLSRHSLYIRCFRCVFVSRLYTGHSWVSYTLVARLPSGLTPFALLTVHTTHASVEYVIAWTFNTTHPHPT